MTTTTAIRASSAGNEQNCKRKNRENRNLSYGNVCQNKSEEEETIGRSGRSFDNKNVLQYDLCDIIPHDNEHTHTCVSNCAIIYVP